MNGFAALICRHALADVRQAQTRPPARCGFARRRRPSSVVDAHSRTGAHLLGPGQCRDSKYRRKLDAIDTDQITPAADCVSDSLDTLDERWKAGAFRYLMPDFRTRVHRGETFVIAGDRFAIGSSREMSPGRPQGHRRRGRASRW